MHNQMRCYVDTKGNYVGHFDTPQTGLIEVPVDVKPKSALEVFDLEKGIWIEPIEELKREAKLRIIAFANELTNQIKTAHRGGIPFPEGEEAAWHEKTPEAREIVSIPEDTPLDVTKYPILNTLFDGNDTAMRTEAIKIVYFADRFKKAAALIQKIREETERAIDACNSSEEIAQVLETAKASAQGAMETL